MAASLQPVRGTRDILFEEQRLFRHVVDTAWQIAQRYGYQEVGLPIFEFTDVFKRTLGDASDVVTKEMYTFEDRGGESITLRPEFTAGVARSVISNGLFQHLPLKLFSSGPVFRYERPQKGRYRQFHQINMEALGLDDPRMDAEIIAMAAQILEALGIAGEVTLHLNSLGDTPTRDAYRTALVEYFSDHKDSLSEDSLTRLEKNPLRILDSKDQGDKALVKDAPRMSDYLTQEAQDFFCTVTTSLDRMNISYVLDPTLVRGLDYYSHTAFEFITDRLGAQGTVLAGGRYDGLITQMGGKDTPAVGFAAGIERLSALALVSSDTISPIAVIPVGDICTDDVMVLVYELRKAGYPVVFDYKGNTGKRMKRADKAGASIALLLGEDEKQKGVIRVRHMKDGQEEEVSLTSLLDYIAGLASR